MCVIWFDDVYMYNYVQVLYGYDFELACVRQRYRGEYSQVSV